MYLMLWFTGRNTWKRSSFLTPKMVGKPIWISWICPLRVSCRLWNFTKVLEWWFEHIIAAPNIAYYLILYKYYDHTSCHNNRNIHSINPKQRMHKVNHSPVLGELGLCTKPGKRSAQAGARNMSAEVQGCPCRLCGQITADKPFKWVMWPVSCAGSIEEIGHKLDPWWQFHQWPTKPTTFVSLFLLTLTYGFKIILKGKLQER